MCGPMPVLKLYYSSESSAHYMPTGIYQFRIFIARTCSSSSKKIDYAPIKFIANLMTRPKTTPRNFDISTGIEGKKNFFYKKTLEIACHDGFISTVRALEGMGVPLTQQCMNFAAEKGHIVIVKFLISKGLKATETAALIAANNWKNKVVEYFNEMTNAGRIENIGIWNVWCVVSGNYKGLNRVYENGFSFDKKHLELAVLHGKRTVVNFFQSIGITSPAAINFLNQKRKREENSDTESETSSDNDFLENDEEGNDEDEYVPSSPPLNKKPKTFDFGNSGSTSKPFSFGDSASFKPLDFGDFNSTFKPFDFGSSSTDFKPFEFGTPSSTFKPFGFGKFPGPSTHTYKNCFFKGE